MANEKLNPIAARIVGAVERILKDGGSMQDALFIVSDMYGISAEKIQEYLEMAKQ